MKPSKFNTNTISKLGFGLMRLPRTSDTSSEINYDTSAKLVDYAMANGINFFDMAYTYEGNEDFAGAVFSKYPRDSYKLATKCPPWMVKTPEDFKRIIEEQLVRCKTDYFDYYLVHNLAQEMKRAEGNEEYFKNFERNGMYEALQKKKAEGVVRNVGFSFHGTLELFKRLIDGFNWDFVYIQLNYVDWKATDAKTQYELATERGIPVIVMEPLRGGTLVELGDEATKLLKKARPNDSLASWGIRYAASLPNVISVLSGMNSMEQLKDNIATIESFTPVTEQDKTLLDMVTEIYNKSGAISCTGCEYCVPCPRGVNIPKILSYYNLAMRRGYRIPFDNGYSTLSDSEKASNCNACGLCAEKCPQHLPIADHMNQIDEYSR